MKIFMTFCVKHFLFLIIISLCLVAKNSKADDSRDARDEADKEIADEMESQSYLKIFEISPIDLNFAFEKDSLILITTQEDFEKFWTEHSRNLEAKPPHIGLNWKTENLIIYFWKSVDDLKRMSSVSSFRFEENELFIHAALADMCFAIITDISPSLFFGVPKNKIKEVSQIKLETSFMKENCL